MHKEFVQYKEALRQQLSSNGSEQFQKACSLYGQYLTEERVGLSSFAWRASNCTIYTPAC